MLVIVISIIVLMYIMHCDCQFMPSAAMLHCLGLFPNHANKTVLNQSLIKSSVIDLAMGIALFSLCWVYVSWHVKYISLS